jgi:hypothetical protein
MLLKSINGWTSVHGIMSDIARQRQKGGSILWTYIETNKLPLTLSRRQFVDHFLLVGMQPYLWIATMGMKNDTLFEHKKVVINCEKTMKTLMNIVNCWNHQLNKKMLLKKGKQMWCVHATNRDISRSIPIRIQTIWITNLKTRR